jgi:chromosome partitioning protein
MDTAELDMKSRHRTRRKDVAPYAEVATDTLRVAPTERRQRMCVVAGPKGGLGKTSLSRNLAIAALRSGVKVALADLDRQRTLTKWYGRRPEGMAEIPLWTAEMADIEELLTAISGYDLVIVDTPPGIEAFPEHVERLVEAADLVLVPCGPSIDESESVTEWAAHLRRLGKPYAFVLTRAERNTNSTKKARMDLIKAGRLCPFDVPKVEDMKRSSELGLGLLEIRGAAGSDDIKGVFEFVRQELALEEV